MTIVITILLSYVKHCTLAGWCHCQSLYTCSSQEGGILLLFVFEINYIASSALCFASLRRGVHSVFPHGLPPPYGAPRAGQPDFHSVRKQTPERDHRLSPLASSSHPDAHRVREIATSVRHSSKYSLPSNNNSDRSKRVRPSSRDSADVLGGWVGIEREHEDPYDTSSHFSNNSAAGVHHDETRVASLSPLHPESYLATTQLERQADEQPERLLSTHYKDDSTETLAPTGAGRDEGGKAAGFVQLVDG
jgi:hypothetical protein